MSAKENAIQPALPVPSGSMYPGFTKRELASLIIFHGLLTSNAVGSNGNVMCNGQQLPFDVAAVKMADSWLQVLEK